MDKLLELRRKRAELNEQARGMLNKADAENRDLNEDEAREYDGLLGQIDVLGGRINREERQMMLDGELSQRQHEPTLPDPKDGGQRTEPTESEARRTGDFLLAVRTYAKTNGRTILPALESRAATGMSEGVPSDGGFLVDHQTAPALYQKVYEAADIYNKCWHVEIGAGFNGLKMNYVNETSRANGSRFGGVQTYFASEAGTVTATKPKFGQIDFSLQKLMAVYYSTDELIADSTALGSVVSTMFAKEFAFKLNDQVVRGSGAGQMTGILNSPALVSVSAEANQAATTIVFENIVNMYSRMYGPNRRNAVWLINQDIEPQLFTMSLAVGAGGVPVYLPASGASGSPYGTLMGRPVIPAEQCSTLGTVGDIMLVDLSEYLTIEKGGLQSASSIHVQFLADEEVFRFIYRVNGMPTWQSALTPFSGSANTLSPYVALTTRS